VTAVAVGSPYGVRRPPAVAPAGGATPLRRVLGSFHEPNAWTVSLLLATGLIIIARHPIAHALGTETDAPAVSVQAPAAVVGSAAVRPGAPALTAGAAVPTHAPIDPFRPLVAMTGRLLAPVPATVAASVPKSHSESTGVKDAATAAGVTPATATCAGAVHRVVSGDSLWSLAARATRSTDTGRVTLAWHQLYAANRDTLGANPSLLRIGEQLCIPTKL
jgi:nucleoid-associated protein YgaU